MRMIKDEKERFDDLSIEEEETKKKKKKKKKERKKMNYRKRLDTIPIYVDAGLEHDLGSVHA